MITLRHWQERESFLVPALQVAKHKRVLKMLVQDMISLNAANPKVGKEIDDLREVSEPLHSLLVWSEM